MTSSDDGAQQYATWRVTGQTEGTQITPSGQVVDGVTVSFTTGAGATGSVFVPMSQYTPAIVRGLVQARANIVDQVSNLTSEG